MQRAKTEHLARGVTLAATIVVPDEGEHCELLHAYKGLRVTAAAFCAASQAAGVSCTQAVPSPYTTLPLAPILPPELGKEGAGTSQQPDVVVILEPAKSVSDMDTLIAMCGSKPVQLLVGKALGCKLDKAKLQWGQDSDGHKSVVSELELAWVRALVCSWEAAGVTATVLAKYDQLTAEEAKNLKAQLATQSVRRGAVSAVAALHTLDLVYSSSSLGQHYTLAARF
jgi:hypothetical protein